MAHVDPVSSFRDGYAYQNVTFLIAARLIEERTGLPWEDNLALRLFGPLGMTSSTTDRALFESMPDVATGHIPSGGGYYAIPKGWPWSQWLDVLGPAGNIRSNVPDMARWAIFNLGDGTYEGQTLLTPSTFRLLKAPRTLAGSQPDSSVSYAQGWVHVSRAPHPVVWHNGGTAGMHSIVFLVPDARVGLVMLTNSSDNKVPENSGWKLYDLLFGTNLAPTAAVRGMVELGEQARQTADIPAFASVPPLPLDRYVGTYQNPAYGRAVVTATGDKLQFTLGPKHVTMDLAHYSGNTFRLVATGTPAQAGLVTFVVKGSQKAERFVSTLLSESNGGNFVAVR
jgi:CubicO group peptidase (beta-lactamase class C family)